MPDCFWVEAHITLALGALPANSGQQPIGGTGPAGWSVFALRRSTLGALIDDTRAEHRLRVAQAQGMVSVQADCTIDEALVLMKERAAVALDEIASAVLARSIRFGV